LESMACRAAKASRIWTIVHRISQSKWSRVRTWGRLTVLLCRGLDFTLSWAEILMSWLALYSGNSRGSRSRSMSLSWLEVELHCKIKISWRPQAHRAQGQPMHSAVHLPRLKVIRAKNGKSMNCREHCKRSTICQYRGWVISRTTWDRSSI
jgi:hypothetical protein